MRKSIATALSKLLKPLGLAALRQKDLDHLENRMAALTEIITGRVQYGQSPQTHSAEGIVFSKDRAIQLHALLSSYRDMVKDPVPLHLLYAVSSDRHRRAYQQVIELHHPLLSIVEEQTNFQAQTVSILDRITAPATFFLVDDIVFIRPVDLKTVSLLPCSSFVLSLRLAPHLRYCYTLQKEQPVPELKNHESGLLTWRWDEGKYDWNYPLSIDGHFFATTELRAMARHTRFSAPNSFEHALQDFNDLFLPRFGACFAESRIVNIPMNKVQMEIDNRSGEVHQDELLDQWENGMRIGHEKFYNTVNESAHQELPVNFSERK